MVKYPAGQGRSHITNKVSRGKNTVNYSNRGMSLEEMLINSNQYYLTHNIAVIHKKPTPIQVVKVDYPRRSAARIVEAYYRRASTTDFNGIYQGKYIDFEAKETNHMRFPLNNLPEHQITHMQQCMDQGGIVFIIIYFKKIDKIILMPFVHINNFIEQSNAKSIPYDYFVKYGYVCEVKYSPTVDYLKAVDQWLQEV